MPVAQDIDAEVVSGESNDVTATMPQMKFNLGTTLQSPFFWLVVGVGIGVWMGWDKGNKRAGQTPWF